MLGRYDSMFKRYRLEEANLAALKFAPFHLIAVEGQHFFDRSHLWHMQVLGRLARSGDGFLIPTRYETVDTKDAATWQKTIRWWEEITNDCSEGLVIKPLPFVPRGRRGLAQPALKCRTREHLRLVYGPRYDSTEARELLLSRDALLHRRNKHRRILRQFALSIEAVARFVQRKPAEAVHECILGLLAQEVAPAMRQ
jgi:protein phosphatase